MEFSSNLSQYFPCDIAIVRTNLLPVSFCGSSETTRLCVALVSEILDKMGEASAVAQKLQTPVTSSIKFSHSDQIIYLMIDLHENTVVGFLKMGWKNLFIFDTEGSYIKRRCFCCLDFYIHESKQRRGYGKRLYDFMLQDNNIRASSIPIDRPSDKLLKFLVKHYNLRTIIPQANNFILYEQFFTEHICETRDSEKIVSFSSANRNLTIGIA